MNKLLIKIAITFMYLFTSVLKLINPTNDINKLYKVIPFNTNFLYYLVVLAAILEITASINILLGNKYQDISINFLILFTLLVSFMFYRNKLIPFSSNLSIVGGLLALKSLKGC